MDIALSTICDILDMSTPDFFFIMIKQKLFSTHLINYSFNAYYIL